MAWIHNKRIIPSIPIAPETSEEILNHFKEIHHRDLGQSVLSPDPKEARLLALAAANLAPSSIDAQQGLMTCISLFGTALQKNTEIRQSERKARELENEQKEWKKLTPLSRGLIEAIQVQFAKPSDFDTEEEFDDSDGYFIPTGPTKDFQAVIQSTTGARAMQHLQHMLVTGYRCIVALQLGMCTCLKNGLLMSQPTPYDASNFSPHFTPPSNKEETISAAEQQKLEEQARNGKLSDTDLSLITKQTIEYPTNYNDLRHFTKKFYCLLILLAGEQAILTMKFKGVYSHVINYEQAYVYYMGTISQFGAFFVGKYYTKAFKFFYTHVVQEIRPKWTLKPSTFKTF